ncbi:MAG: UDP-3-O-acyl-N-acetylglucosamine deacetylase [Planctomycetota bacterium]
MTRKERTLKRSATMEGVALHSGETVQVQVEPAPAGTGVVFRRGDVTDPAEIPALAGNLSISQRRTVLREGGSDVGMVEHILAACSGCQVDNLIVTVSADEMPGTDGSAQPYVDMLQGAGIVEQKRERTVFTVKDPHIVREGDAELVVLPPSGAGLRVRYLPSYPDGVDATPVIFDSATDDFVKEIAPARTFVRASEVEALLEAGLGKGATADNTLVLGGEEAPEMRVDLEPTRHKILDLMGDMALLGADLHADVVAVQSGHGLNQAMVKHLRGELELLEVEEPVNEDGYGINEVMRLLPHRYPFLLVDRVLKVEGWRRAVGIKNVTINEPFFNGHFPDQPLMPGVLQLEALAQLSGFLLQRKMEHTGKLVVLAAIDKVRFRGGVVPGDQLRLEVETLRMNRNRATIKAQGKVGRRVVSEAVLSFAMVAAS